MRLKTIHARTMQQAIELIREQMGAEAIIVATHEDERTRGVRVTAASVWKTVTTGDRTRDLVRNLADDRQFARRPRDAAALTDKLVNSVTAQAKADAHMSQQARCRIPTTLCRCPNPALVPDQLCLSGRPAVGKPPLPLN